MREILFSFSMESICAFPKQAYFTLEHYKSSKWSCFLLWVVPRNSEPNLRLPSSKWLGFHWHTFCVLNTLSYPHLLLSSFLFICDMIQAHLSHFHNKEGYKYVFKIINKEHVPLTGRGMRRKIAKYIHLPRQCEHTRSVIKTFTRVYLLNS